MFTTDSRTENFLTQIGASFIYTNNLRFSELQIGWERVNTGRPVAIRENAVEQYCQLMLQGSAAPAPTLAKSKDGLCILDGVQRCAAASLAGETFLSAYIVETDSENMLNMIRVMSNSRLQGYAESPEWTRKQAVEVLAVDGGMSFKEVAKLGGWRLSDVESIAKSCKLRRLCESIGGPELPDSMLSVISQHAEKHDILKAAKPIADFLWGLKEAKLSADDAQPYIEDFFMPFAKASRACEYFIDRLKQFRKDPDIEVRIKGRKSTRLAADTRLLRCLKATSTTLNEIVDSGEDLLYVEEYFKHLSAIEKKLKEFSKRSIGQVVARVNADLYKKETTYRE